MPRTLSALFLGILCLIACTGKHRSGKPFLHSSECDETSGIDASSIHQNVLYVHNDSGDVNRFFAVSTNGELLATCFYSTGSKENLFSASDCEDLAVGPGPEPGKSYVYIADIGDNGHKRDFVTIYRVEEPSAFQPFMHLRSDTLSLRYPDGPRDAETLMIDPRSRLLYIVSKREDSVRVYATPAWPWKSQGRVLLKSRNKIHFEGNNDLKWITSGKISADGKQVVLRSYNKVYHWDRREHEPIEETLARTPDEVDAPLERQAEAICFSRNGKALFSVSEGRYRRVNYIPIPALFGKKD